MTKDKLRSWLPLILLLSLLALFFIFRLDQYLSFSFLHSYQAQLIYWTNTYYILTVLLFLTLYTLAVAISLPGAIFFTLASGFLFGVFWGIVYVIIAATSGATILYFAVRTSLGNWLAKSASQWTERMRAGFQDNAFSYLLTLRLIPIVPFWVVNIIPGLLGVKPKTFILATFIGIIPGTAVFVILGSGIQNLFAMNQTPNLHVLFTPSILFPLLALAGLSLLPVIYKAKISKSSPKNSFITVDLVIIGAGPGGLSVASVATQLGLKVILVESGLMGGDCLNYGCIPSKALLASAKTAHLLRQAHNFGIEVKGVDINFLNVLKHVHDVIKELAEHDSVERFKSLGVDVIEAEARFTGKNTITAKDLEIQAKHFVIATGSNPLIPSIPGLDITPYFTNESIFNLTEQPEHLMVIGGGPIGCELAQAFSMLGTHVTLVEQQTLLSGEDEDCVTILRDQLNRMNISIYEHCTVQEVHSVNPQNIKIVIQKKGELINITGSHLLIATGRKAHVTHLGLDKAGIDYTAQGINVNSYLQTSNNKVYAIGDVVGPFRFTHMASYQAGIVIRNIIFKLPSKVNYQNIPRVTFTEPEIAHVGISEKEASQQKNIKLIQWPFKENDRANTDLKVEGKIKVFTDAKARILGVTIIGHCAGELILPWIMAVKEQKTLRSFTDVIVPYPTFSEISKQVAAEYYKPQLFSKKVRLLVSWLNKL